MGDVRSYIEPLEPLEIPVSVGAGKDDGDVERFLQHELEKISKAAGLEHTWVESEIKRDAGALASRAGGLFQWARLLSSLLSNRIRPREVVLRVLEGIETSAATPEVNLDVMYTEALNIALPTVAAASADRDLGVLYRRVVGTVLAAQQPLTVSAICTLLEAGEDDASSAIRKLLENLGCVLVLYPIRGGAIVVRIAHPSFHNYVTSQDRCPPSWFIDAHQASVQLGSRCFSLMAKALRKDICRMGGPSVMNKDVSSGTVYRYIVTGLRYACSYAFMHISGDGGNLRMLETFLMEKLMEWLEAMSLMKLLDTAVELMQHTLAELGQVCRIYPYLFDNPSHYIPLPALCISTVHLLPASRSSRMPYGSSGGSEQFWTRAPYTYISQLCHSRHRVRCFIASTQHDTRTYPTSLKATPIHGLRSCAQSATSAATSILLDISRFPRTHLGSAFPPLPI
jgi:hypothetical protein